MVIKFMAGQKLPAGARNALVVTTAENKHGGFSGLFD
jgi:hypothetical protein